MFGIFAVFPLSLIRMCEVIKLPQIFLTRSNQHIQDIDHKSYGTIDHFGHMVFAANQEQNMTYNFKYMF